MQPGAPMDLPDRQAAHEMQPPHLRPLLHSDHLGPPELALRKRTQAPRTPGRLRWSSFQPAQVVQFSPGADSVLAILQSQQRVEDTSLVDEPVWNVRRVRFQLLAAITLVAVFLLSGLTGAAERPSFGRGPPQLLPGDALTARAASTRSSWLVGARPGSDAARVAHEFGARALLRGAGIYRVSAGRARAFAEALRSRGIYEFSEPDWQAVRQAFPFDPLSGSQWALGATGVASLDPPVVTPSSPLLAIVEEGYDPTHPDLPGVTASGPPAGNGNLTR